MNSTSLHFRGAMLVTKSIGFGLADPPKAADLIPQKYFYRFKYNLDTNTESKTENDLQNQIFHADKIVTEWGAESIEKTGSDSFVE